MPRRPERRVDGHASAGPPAPLYADAVRKLKPGETSDILRSPAGFHIVKLVERRGNGLTAAIAQKQTRARHILIKVNELVSADEARRKLVSLKERIDNAPILPNWRVSIPMIYRPPKGGIWVGCMKAIPCRISSTP